MSAAGPTRGIDPDTLRVVGAYIRGLREARGLAPRQLADLSGYQSFAHIGAIEAGRMAPQRARLAAMADALGVDVLSFVTVVGLVARTLAEAKATREAKETRAKAAPAS